MKNTNNLIKVSHILFFLYYIAKGFSKLCSLCFVLVSTFLLNRISNQKMKQRQRSQKYRGEGFDMVVYDVFQELYEAIFYKIYTVWVNEGKTMLDSGFVLRDVETLAKQKPVDLMKAYTKVRDKSKLNGESSSSTKEKKKQVGDDEKIESFVGIEDL